TPPPSNDTLSLPDALPISERRLAIEAARAAGELLLSELAGSRRIAFKGAPTNLVTEMDARAEALILGRLRAEFPEDAILSEEMRSEEHTSELQSRGHLVCR